MLFTFPSRYWYTIGQTGILRLTPRSGLIHTGFHEARATWANCDTETTRIRLRGHHPLRPGIQSCSPHTSFYHSARPRRRPDTQARNTPRATPDGYHTRKVWPGPLSLATTHGISFPAGTEMFHFPAYPPAPKGAVTAHDGCRVTPFRNPRIKASSAAPRGISLPATSFIGPVCQGIHHTPLQATPHTGNPQDQTNTGRQIINTLRSQNDQTNNQTPKTGTRSKYISTSRPRPATPTGAATRSARVHSPVLKPPRHTTHPHPATTGQEPMAGTRTPTPDKEGRGGQGTQQHAHTRPHNRDATILPRQHARHPREQTPGTMPGTQ